MLDVFPGANLKQVETFHQPVHGLSGVRVNWEVFIPGPSQTLLLNCSWGFIWTWRTHTCLLVEDHLFFALSPSGNEKRTHTPRSTCSYEPQFPLQWHRCKKSRCVECKSVTQPSNLIYTNDWWTSLPIHPCFIPPKCRRLCGIKCDFTVNKLGYPSRKLEQPQETAVLSFHPVSEGLTAGSASAGTVRCSSQNNMICIQFVVIFHTMHAT